MARMLAGRSFCLVILLAVFAQTGVAASLPEPRYDPDPRHLWNRLDDTLFTRTAPDGERFANTELDILYWDSTRHLLTSPSREQAIQVLDEFIRGRGERSIRDPVKRAILQRDLWALFDWSARDRSWAEPGVSELQARADLQKRLVTVIKRLALPPDAIDALPDNYAEAAARLEEQGIPQGLFSPDGTWQLVGQSYGPAANEHAIGFGGRSVFLVFVKFPGGRQPALEYLKTLREFSPALVFLTEMQPGGPQRVLRTNPATPQFPVGTQWALVRRLCLIDDQGEIHMTPLIESIQMRTYDAIPDDASLARIQNTQTVAEFQLDRGNMPTLRVIEKGAREFQSVHFMSAGGDPLQMSAGDWAAQRDRLRGDTLRRCTACHQFRGILSVNTYSKFGLAANPLDATTPEQEARATRGWKTARFDWGLFTGLWRNIR